MRRFAFVALLLGVGALAAVPARAGSVEKTAPFALDTWIDLNSTDGPVSIHKLRIERQKGGLSKSAFLRPGNDEYLDTLQIQIEFSNSTKDDWKAHLSIKWLDDQGTVIDGYDDKENLDDSSDHAKDTVTLSTLKYGTARAKQLQIKITYGRD